MLSTLNKDVIIIIIIIIIIIKESIYATKELLTFLFSSFLLNNFLLNIS